MPATAGTCGSAANETCDNFQLNIAPPPPDFGSYIVEIRLVPNGDWDLEVYDSQGNFVDDSGNLPGQTEVVVLENPAAGSYTVAAAPYAPIVGPDANGDMVPDSYTATAQLKRAQSGGSAGELITYAIYQPPAPMGRSSGEPSVGVNWKTNRVMYISGLETLRLTFDDCSSPPRELWEDKSYLTTSVFTGDPILFTDNVTGRTFVSQLLGAGVGTPVAVVPALTGQSLMAYTDDDGENWVPSQGSGIASGVDHQTVGGGRFADPLTRDPNGPVYPNAVYYCSQNIADAVCARSDNGGLTFGPAVPIYTAVTCNGLHGAVKVSPVDGTVYVPNKSCGGQQAVVVSEDNGLTWEVRPIPGSSEGDTDPSVGIASDGTVYFGYADGDGHPKVAVSTDHGRTWFNKWDLGTGVTIGSYVGLRHTVFPVTVAGDPARAAVSWLGSAEPTPGGTGDDPTWPGDWYVFAAHTYDGGLTWTTINVTSDDPVQRGTICAGGTGCANGTRNLLDFNDSDIDAEGRVVLAYADGCIGPCVSGRPNSFSDLATVARQVNGRRIFARFDSQGVPGAPLVSGAFDSCPNPASVVLSWPRPDDHGSAITSFNIFRRTGSESAFSLLAAVPGDVNAYTDSSFDAAQENSYQVTAVNGFGEGAACGEASPSCPIVLPPEDPCEEPGVTVLTDVTGDFTLEAGMQTFFGPALDMQKLSLAEPEELGAGKVMFLLKVVSLQSVPPQTTWPIQFRANGSDYLARMHTDALSQVFFTLAPGTLADPVRNPGVAADPASGFSPDGTIRIVVPRSAMGDPPVGQDLTSFLIRVTSPHVVSGLTPDNMPDSLTPTGTYTLRGSENCVCEPPAAVDDSANAHEGLPVTINLVANDADGGEPPLTIVAVTQPANGSVDNNGDGTVTYQSNAGFAGSDSFTYTIQNDCGSEDSAAVQVTVAPRVVCFEDTASEIAYTDGWHAVDDPDATEGHYRFHAGRSPEHKLTFAFDVEGTNGLITYTYGRSPKGETADVYIDGVYAETISYQGPNGSVNEPEFGCAACSRSYSVSAGAHTFELRNVKNRVYVDRFCVSNGASNAAPATGPGQTSSSSSAVAAGGSKFAPPISLGGQPLAISVVAEVTPAVPMKLLLIDPAGLVLTSADAVNGVAVINKPVTANGTYAIKAVNLSLGPIQVWTAATPTVTR
jgi:hypothetical protein